MQHLKSEYTIPLDVIKEYGEKEMDNAALYHLKQSVASKMKLEVQYIYVDETTPNASKHYLTEIVVMSREEYDNMNRKLRIYDSIFERKLS